MRRTTLFCALLLTGATITVAGCRHTKNQTSGSLAFQVDEFNCLENLKRNVCYAKNLPTISPYEEDMGSAIEKKHIKQFQEFDECDGDKSSKYRKKLVELYPDFPALVQKSFCHINRIYIVKNEDGAPASYGARAMRHYDISTIETTVDDEDNYVTSGVVDGFVLLISEQNRFEARETGTQGANRRMQKKFGHNTKNGVDTNLPHLEMVGNPPHGQLEDTFLTIVHEAAHFIDFANHLSDQSVSDFWEQYSFKKRDDNYEKVAKGVPLGIRNNRYFRHFSGTPGPFPQSDIPDLLKAMKDHGFPSIYGMKRASEDFAEYFTFYFMSDFSIKAGGVTIEKKDIFNKNAGRHMTRIEDYPMSKFSFFRSFLSDPNTRVGPSKEREVVTSRAFGS